MPYAWHALLHPSLPRDRVAAERARTLYVVLIASTLLELGLLMLLWRTASSLVITAYAALIALNLIELAVLVSGRGRLAAALHSILYLAVVFAVMARAGGLVPQAGFFLPPIVLVTGLTWSGRAAFGVAISASAAGLGLVYLDRVGWLPPGPPAPSPMRIWGIMTAALGMTATFLYLALRVQQRSAKEVELHAARARELVEGAPDAMLFIDARGVIAGVNSAACDLLECSEAELAGRSWRELPLLDVDAVDRLERAMQAPSTNDAPLLIETTNTSGCHVALEARVRLLPVETGEAAWHFTLRDVTERLQAQAQERALAEQLEASRRLEAIGRLAGGVAHDFNNLLTVILGQIDLLPRYDPKVDESARILEASALRAAELTRGLLAVGGKRWLSPESVDLNERVRLLEPMIRGLMRPNIELCFTLADEVPWVRMDRSQLDQVILNLAVNARDALMRGGWIEIATEMRSESSEAGPTRFAVLSVSDDGIGIPGEIRDRIFEPFFTTKSEGQGTGLGLATVQGVVAQSGGRVEVENRVPTGTRFLVMLPETELYTPVRRPVLRHKPFSARVLLIEEDPEVRRITSALLRSAGHRVDVADGATAALQTARGRRALDVAVADVQRLGLSATDLARRLRRFHPQLKLLICGAYAPADVSGDDPDVLVIAKPYTRTDLLDALQHLLGSDEVTNAAGRVTGSRDEPARSAPGDATLS